MRMLLVAGFLALCASTPASAQFYETGNQYQQNDTGTERTLCDIERYARVVQNVTNALRDQGGYAQTYGGYGCQRLRSRYQDPYRQQQPYLQQYQYPQRQYQQYPPYQGPYQPQGQPIVTFDSFPPSFPPSGNNRGNVCVSTTLFSIC